MPNVSQLMTRGARKLAPSDTVALAARAMDELNIGAVPVCDGEKLIGMITDRDIVLRGVAQARPSDTPVSEIMSTSVVSCFEDEAAESAMEKMERFQIRRLPVVDHEQLLVGMLSLGDLSAKGEAQKAGHALHVISQPAGPDPAGTSMAAGDRDIVAPAHRSRDPLAGQPDARPAAEDADAEVLDVLNDLLKTSRDGEYGFRTCAEEVKASKLMAVFNDRAEECRRAAEELTQLIAGLGGSPADGGTTSGAMHRGWVHVKGAVGANSELSMLEECERGEDAAVERYRRALAQNLPAEVRSLVERQAQGAQRNHDEIRDLRDQARARH